MIHALLLPLLACLPALVPNDTLAIVHAEVLPMNSEAVLHDHTVIVQGGRIEALGPADEVAVPQGAKMIDGRGCYLMPGLADMHVHTWFEEDLALFLANGVTTVRNMFGSPMHLEWRNEIEAGERLGPTIYTAGPIVDGKPPIWPGSRVATNEEEGRAAVRDQAEAGYDFIKVYNRLSLEAYQAIVIEADEIDIPVMGHVPDAVGLEEVLLAGQTTIEHLAGYESALVSADTPRGVGFLSELACWEHVDPTRFAEAVQRTREAGVWNCPTIVVMCKWLNPDEIEKELARPFMRHVSEEQLAAWREMPRGGEAAAVARAGHEGRLLFTKALHDGGAGIVLGTDQGNPYVVAGYSVHEELAYFIEAGLTPYQALRCATRSAAECMTATDEFGSIAVGLRADLLLLEADPLADVANARKRAGLIVRGRWFPEGELQALLVRGE